MIDQGVRLKRGGGREYATWDLRQVGVPGSAPLSNLLGHWDGRYHRDGP